MQTENFPLASALLDLSDLGTYEAWEAIEQIDDTAQMVALGHLTDPSDDHLLDLHFVIAQSLGIG